MRIIRRIVFIVLLAYVAAIGILDVAGLSAAIKHGHMDANHAIILGAVFFGFIATTVWPMRRRAR